MKDLFNELKAVTAFETKLLAGTNTTLKGIAVDRAGYDSATAVVSVGDSPETLAAGLYIQPKLMESDTTVDGDFTAVAEADMLGGSAQTSGTDGEIALINAPTEDKLVYMAGYRGNKRYLRVDFVLVGANTTGASGSAVILLSHASKSPLGACAAGAALT